MDGTQLKEMRRSFGWTQRELADEMDVDVATISRWERGKTQPSMVNGSRVGRIAWNMTSGNGNRGYLYGNAMVPPRIMTEVTHDPGWTFLAWGERLLLIAISEGARRKFPIVQHILGHEAADMLIGEGRELYLRYLPITSDLLSGSTSVVRFVTPLVINLPIVAPGYYQHIFTFPGRDLVKMSTAPITPEEYEDRKGEAEFID